MLHEFCFAYFEWAYVVYETKVIMPLYLSQFPMCCVLTFFKVGSCYALSLDTEAFSLKVSEWHMPENGWMSYPAWLEQNKAWNTI